MPVDEIIRALDTIFDAHVAVASAGFVAVDFYDGAMIYDFENRQVHLCDLDSYRALYDVARAAMELDPDKRFASVSEFLKAWRGV